MSEEEATYKTQCSTEAVLSRFWDGRCRKCRREIGRHRPTCEDYDLASAVNRIAELDTEIARMKKSRYEAYDERARWQSKFRQVAHENNQLRRALHQQ